MHEKRKRSDPARVQPYNGADLQRYVETLYKGWNCMDHENPIYKNDIARKK